MARQQSLERELCSKSSNNSTAIKQIHFLTLFPEAIEPVLTTSMLGRAVEKGLIEFHLHQIRDYAKDKHRTVDDSPYGGGAGMVMKADVLYDAWKAAVGTEAGLTLLMSPQGKKFNQGEAKYLAGFEKLILVCGHYEGVDERFVEECVDAEYSIGDYVLTGGELPAAAIADTVTRLVPGVVGKSDNVSSDTFEDGLLKYPQYTRPPVFNGRKVPDVLLTGNHQEIAKWRDGERVKRTKARRPDLIS